MVYRIQWEYNNNKIHYVYSALFQSDVTHT